MSASFTTPTVTVTLANPLVVAQTGPVGIRMDFRLDKSIQVSGGEITGQVNPTLDITAVGPNDPGVGKHSESLSAAMEPAVTEGISPPGTPGGFAHNARVNPAVKLSFSETAAATEGAACP